MQLILYFTPSETHFSSSPETECQQVRAAVYPWRCIPVSLGNSIWQCRKSSRQTNIILCACCFGHVGFSRGFSRFSCTQATQMLVWSLVFLRLDYCNWFLADQTSASDPSTVFSHHPIAAFLPALLAAQNSGSYRTFWQTLIKPPLPASLQAPSNLTPHLSQSKKDMRRLFSVVAPRWCELPLPAFNDRRPGFTLSEL